jgi:hypothetical protein
MRLAVGLKARTGWAALVALAGDVREPRLVERARIILAPPGVMAPYHEADGLDPRQAQDSVRRSIAAVNDLATDAIRAAARRFAAAGHDLAGCAVLVGSGMPNWTTDEILAVHVRMHKAEGELFRDALVMGAQACGLNVTTLPHQSAIDAAAKTLDLTRGQLDAILTALGKSAGPPWSKDQKEAAAAALVALK